MSQQITSINGGTQQIVTTTSSVSVDVLSPQYVIAKNLQPRPTEWVPQGRPIYRRLPAASETYQIDFFNIVSPPNTAVKAELQKIGYIYIPFTENSNGPTSVLVSSSETKQDLLIRGGKIVWEYGGTLVYPAIVNLETLEMDAGTYFVGYELIYDNSIQQKIYTVTDFALTGQPLTITSSTDGVVGWRYPAQNAFLNSSDLFWATEDTYLPSYAQPIQSFLQWESSLGAAYSNITLRCPSGVTFLSTASLYYVTSDGIETLLLSVSPSVDSVGQYYKFSIESPAFNTGWKIVWSDIGVSIQSVTVSGSIILEKKAATSSTKASLVIYPQKVIPATSTFCPLANVTVNNEFKVESIQDIRFVIRRDYVPVSDWLTKFFDDNLINLYEQVLEYPTTWMNPPTCLKQEYAALASQNIVIV